MLGKVFMDAFQKCPETNPNCAANNFVPPLIGNPGDPSLIGSLIGLGIILMTPNVVNMLKTALKAPKIDTGGVGKALGAGPSLVQSAFGTAMQGLNLRYQWRMLHPPKQQAAQGQVTGPTPPGGGGGHP